MLIRLLHDFTFVTELTETDRVTADQQNEFDRAIRSTSVNDRKCLLAETAMKKIQKAYSLPSRYKLTNTLLGAEYDTVSIAVNEGTDV